MKVMSLKKARCLATYSQTLMNEQEDKDNNKNNKGILTNHLDRNDREEETGERAGAGAVVDRLKQAITINEHNNAYNTLGSGKQDARIEHSRDEKGLRSNREQEIDKEALRDNKELSKSSGGKIEDRAEMTDSCGEREGDRGGDGHEKGGSRANARGKDAWRALGLSRMSITTSKGSKGTKKGEKARAGAKPSWPGVDKTSLIQKNLRDYMTQPIVKDENKSQGS